MWRAGDIIRDKETGRPFFVIQVYRGTCTLIFDPSLTGTILPIGILLIRDYPKFALDIEMEEIKKDLLGDAIILKYKPLPKIKEND